MSILNEYDIETSQRKAAQEVNRPNLQAGILTLARLSEWANANSDGWAYWRKPSAASSQLQELIYTRYFGADRHHFENADISPADLRKAYTPIKAFLTRQGVDHSVIFVNG